MHFWKVDLWFWQIFFQGHFIEVQVTDGALYRTKIHCYFLDQTRVIRTPPNEKNYHIFYQMLAGLSHEERVKLNLEGYNLKNLRYLQHSDTRQDETEDAARFQAWKTCLGENNSILFLIFPKSYFFLNTKKIRKDKFVIHQNFV